MSSKDKNSLNKENLRELLSSLNFQEASNIWTRNYESGAGIAVDFNKQTIQYDPVDSSFKNGEYPSINKPASGFIIHRDTTLNFSAKENFVCIVCIHLLLEKGYEPKHIVLEPSFQVGHVNKPSYGDILVFDKKYKPLVLIENKTFGAEFSSEWNNMQKDGGQLFSYLGPLRNQLGACENIVLFASEFDDGLVTKSHIITLKDNEKRIAELENPLTFENTDSPFKVWEQTYAKSFETKGLFESDIAPYSIGKTKYTISDLKGLSHAEIRPIYHEFATILRNNAITDFEHSFYILIDLFLCKITDERNNPNDLQFYYKGISRDTPKEYCSRLLKLYKQGKKELFGVDVINKEENDIKQIFDDTNRSLTNGLFKGIKALFEEIKFYNIKKFNFIDVENKEEFELNFQILIKITALIQDINLSNSETNHFFGDLFEGLLSKNVHQTEGQFFTPLPIVNFIIRSLPEFTNSNSVKVLDYACGAGHFLTEFIKTYPNTEVYGIEKSQPLSQVAKIATIINGAKNNTHIVFKDALSHLNTLETRFNGFEEDSFDCIIANPPYSVKGFLNTLTKEDKIQFSLMHYVDEKALESKKSIECFFVERAKYFLKRHGLMGIVLPSSILSNGELYIRVRELLFENFNILSIVSLGSRTFGSTGTNTIILFAQKVAKKNSLGLLDTFISKKDYKQYTNYQAIENYIKKQNYSEQDYFAFMQDDLLNGTLEKHEIFVDYKKNFKKNPVKKSQQNDWFKSSSFYSADLKEKSKEYKKRLSEFLDSDEYKDLEQEEYRKQFISYAKEIEKDKLNTFIQIESNKVLILQSPPDKIGNKSNKAKIVEFLGYDWCNRKGDEGIKYVVDQSSDIEADDFVATDEDDADITSSINSIKYIKTPLYNPSNAYDYTKYSFALRKHICEQCKNKFSFNFEPSEQLKEHITSEKEHKLHYAKLSDMVDFSRTEFDKTIKLNEVKQQAEFKSKYPYCALEEIVDVLIGGTPSRSNAQYFKGNHLWVSISEMKDNIITDTKEKITDDAIRNSNVKLIPKGTTLLSFKLSIGKTAIAGSDLYTNEAIAGLIPRSNQVSNEYLFSLFSSHLINLENVGNKAFGKSLNSSYLKKEVKIPLPPLEVQKHIVEDCQKIDEEYENAKNTIENCKQKIESIMQNVQGVQKKLGEICKDIRDGSHNPPKDIAFSEFKMYSAKNIYDNELHLETDFRYLSEANFNLENKRTNVRIGDVLLTIVASIGRSCVVKTHEKITFQRSVAILTPNKNEIESLYLSYYLNSIEKYLNNIAHGTTQKGVYLNQLKKIDIPVPSIIEQASIITQIEKLEVEINKAKQIISSISERKKAVIKKYLYE